ncbi:MAG: fibrobacter succinogenes major paralogous domain-containing protein [Bacteroidota bacterium]
MNVKSALLACIIIISGLLSKAQSTDTLTDARDGKKYKTITIGTQTWMAENLNYDMSGSWCIDCEIYGRVYTYKAATTGCPNGWHLPSEAEWNVLTDAAGGRSVVGGNLKEAGTGHWKAPNTGATNASGFTALPHGYRSMNGILNFKTKMGSWWSSATDPKYPMNAMSLRLDFNRSDVTYVPSDKNVGLSVRCLKD